MKLAMVIPALLLATALHAQTLKVSMMDSDADSQSVADKIIADISSNPHLTLVSDGSWDVRIMMMCVPGPQACSFVFNYSPDDYLGLSTMLDAGVVTGNSDFMAKGIYSSLCKALTTDKIATANKLLDSKFVNIYKAVLENEKKAAPAAKRQNDGTITPEKHKST